MPGVRKNVCTYEEAVLIVLVRSCVSDPTDPTPPAGGCFLDVGVVRIIFIFRAYYIMTIWNFLECCQPAFGLFHDQKFQFAMRERKCSYATSPPCTGARTHSP